MYNRFKNLKNKEKGQGLVEYALILVLVAIVVIAVLMILGPIIGNVFSTINSSLGDLGSAGGGGGGSLIPSLDPVVAANDVYSQHCSSRGYSSGTTQTWPSGDVVVYLQNDGLTYTRFADDPYFTTNAGDVVQNYGTIPAGTSVTCP